MIGGDEGAGDGEAEDVETDVLAFFDNGDGEDED